MFLVECLQLLLSVTVVGGQSYHSAGFTEPPNAVNVWHTVKSYYHNRHPSNKRTMCAINPPAQVIAVARTQGACLEACFHSPNCVGYNYHWDTTKCELFNSAVPLNYTYGTVCINYLVS